ncbi:MAG: right-handed parallel beta-helix repeat-containing protein, partial [Limisphaerales bacterium]
MKPILTMMMLGATLALAHAAEFYVAPTGNDDNPGTRDQPFATLERARDAVRATTNRDGLEVVLDAGIYRQKKSLEFDARDSGTASQPVVWRSASGETACIIGGMVVP